MRSVSQSCSPGVKENHTMKYDIYSLIGAYCISAQQGQELYDAIHLQLTSNIEIKLDFSGVKDCSALFFNYAIGQLFKDISDADLTRLVEFSNLESMGLKTLEMSINGARRYYIGGNYSQVINRARKGYMANQE